MTPKEKAIELVDRYNKLYGNEIGNYLDFDDAKECALIAMDEIITSNTNVTGQTINGDYWLKVKQEIKKL